MSSLLEKQQMAEQLRDVLRFQDHDDRLEFEVEMIHLDIMSHVRQLMENQGMNKTMLAEQLQTSKGYISQLFSGDKIINLKLLVKLQRIFNVQFTITSQEKADASPRIPDEDVPRNVYQFHQDKGEHLTSAIHPSKRKVA